MTREQNNPAAASLDKNQMAQLLRPTRLQEAYLVGQSDFFELGGVSAHIYEEFEITDLDADLATQCLQTLIDRHDALRIVSLPDGQLQILNKVPSYKIPVIDATKWDEGQVEKELLATRGRLARVGPTTNQWPLFETVCYRLAQGRHHLFVSASLLVLDAHTEGLLLTEWLRLYRSPGTRLPDTDLTYCDYVAALQDAAAADEAEAWEYWHERLPSLPPAPEFPLVQAEKALGGGADLSRRRYRLDADAWQRLKGRARKAKLTPTSVLCAAYAEVLARWGKSQHFTLNVMASGRLPLHPDVPHVAGNFGSTIPLEVDCRGAASLIDRARAVQCRMWDDLEFASVSAVDISRQAARLRGWNSQSALPIVFASGLDSDNSALDDLPFAAREVSGALQTPQIHLDHQVYEYGGALVGNWDAVEEIFPVGMLNEAFAAYRSLIQRLADDDAAWEADTDTLLARSYSPDLLPVVAPGDPEMLHTPFLQQAARRPEQTALIAGELVLSYRELAERSAGVARRLCEAAIGPGSLVPVVMDKGWEQIVAVLGILRTGAAYLPVDAALPSSRIAYLLEQADSGAVLTQSWVDQRVDWPRQTHRLAIDRLPACEAASEWLASGPAAPHSLAYVIYTSGSTGLPKGVAIEHAAAMNTIREIIDRFAVLATDRVFAISSMSFDLSVFDVFGTLAAGGTIVLPHADRMRDPAHWLDLLRRERVTLWNSVPALMDLLVKQAEAGAGIPADLRLVMMSGDWIPVTLPDRIRKLGPQTQVVSLGGATEASIWSIFYPIARVDPSWRSIPYGSAMRHQRMYVLDEGLEPRPTWAVGELFIGGVGLALGYWRDQERTDQRFITHPRTGARLYRTGDLGRYLPDGNIEFLGREDGQVKIQGYRIELGEIESALQRHPSVCEAVVKTHKTANGYTLLAYVVPREGEWDADALRAHLSKHLPGYMVPTQILTLGAVPLTGNGKVDRAALPDPEMLQRSGRPAALGAQDEIERRLLGIWEDVLEIADIAVSDNFFEIGGNSFAAIRVTARVWREFDLDLPLSVLFEARTIGKLAELIRAGRQGSEGTPSILVPIQPLGERPAFYCVHPVGGNVVCYSELAGLLGDDQPFFGLQSAALSAHDVTEQRVEDIASEYVETVLRHCRAGSFSIGGWSMGGVIAFEMARQLTQAGRPPVEVILIDTPFPEPNRRRPATKADLAVRFLKDFRVGIPLTRTESLILAGCPANATALDTVQLMRTIDALPADTDESQVARLFEVFAANTAALSAYVPQPYSGHIRELRAADGVTGDCDGATSPWATMADQTTVFVLDGDHYSIVRTPCVRGVAKDLSRILTNSGSNLAAAFAH